MAESYDHPPCCTACDGTGAGDAHGKCWDCQGTGHTHAPDCMNDPEDVPDGDLPGAWTHSDFLGGDPDERSYAQRERDRIDEAER